MTDAEEYVDLVNGVEKKVDNIKNLIEDFIIKEKSGKRYIIHNFLSLMLDQIDDLIENKAVGILEDIMHENTANIKENITKELSTYQIKDYSNVSDFLKYEIRKFKPILVQAFKLKGDIKRESEKLQFDSDGERYYAIKGQRELKVSKRKVIVQEITKLSFLSAHNLDIDDPIKLTDLEYLGHVISRKKAALGDRIQLNDTTHSDNLKSMILSRNQDLKLLEDDYNVMLGSKNIKEQKLRIEKEKNPSKYSADEQLRINKFILFFTMTINNLQGYHDIVSSIEKKNISKVENEDEQMFINVAGRIIAYSMNNKILREDGNYIGFDSYDMINKVFHCEQNKIINKDDISTGLASANYLKQKIENVEGEFIIVLLDEIGNMDANTLQEVIKSIKTLESDGRLLLAFLTQPSVKKEIVIKQY